MIERPLRIARICEEFPPLKGGLSSGMLDLTTAQHKKGHNVTVITRSHPGDLEVDSRLPFKIIRIRSKKIMTFGLKAYSKIQRFAIKPDIVHSHGPAAFAYLLCRRKEDTPLVHTMHAVRKYQYGLFQNLPDMVRAFEKKLGSSVIKKPAYFKKLSPKVIKELFLEKYICKRVDHLILVAEYFRDQLNEYYGVPLDKMSISYNGSKFKPNDFSETHNSDINPLRIDTTKKIILYIGRTDWVKRVHLLIESMPFLLKKFPDACLVIVGKGDHDADLPRLVDKLMLRDCVKFLSWLPHEELPALFKVAKCFCLPSYWEGLSKAALEAFSAEIPFIGTANLSNMEITNNGRIGWLVNEATPEAWSNAICKVLSGGSDVRERTQNASGIVDQMYRWNHVAIRLQSAYERILSEP